MKDNKKIKFICQKCGEEPKEQGKNVHWITYSLKCKCGGKIVPVLDKIEITEEK